MVDSFKKGRIGHLETSVINYNYTLRNEDLISRGIRLKSRKESTWEESVVAILTVGYQLAIFLEGRKKTIKTLGNVRCETLTTVSTRLLARDAV